MKKCVSVVTAAILMTSMAGAQDTPKSEVFLGYTYTRINSESNIPAYSSNGGGGQFAYNFSKWFSGVIDIGAVHNGDIGGFQIDNTMTNFMLGPRFSLGYSRVRPYFQFLAGGVHMTASTSYNQARNALVLVNPITNLPVVNPLDEPVVITPLINDPIIRGREVSARFVASELEWAWALGGGLDIKINRHLSLRPIGLDWFWTNLQRPRIPFESHQNNLRYTAGLNFLFGGENPTPPPVATKTCWNGSIVPVDVACPKQDLAVSLSASPAEICQGSTAQVTASLTGADASQVNYHWSLNGQPVGQGRSYTFVGQNPGTYNISLMVDNTNFNPGSGDTSITVREYRPPTGTTQANPAQVYVGERSSLTASFDGQCGGTIRPATFTVTGGGMMVGDQYDSTGVLFDPSNRAEQRKIVTVTASASDDRNIGTATTNIEVIKKAQVAAAIRLPDVVFSSNDSRVNNCGKRILLEELRAYIQRDPTGTVVLVGHSSSDETAAGLDLQRTLNAAAVITAGTGVCLSIPQSQVLLNATGPDQNGVDFQPGFCGSSVNASSANANMRRVEVWFIPTGGQPPSSLTKSQNASSLPVSTLGCPK